jgi:transposase
MNATEPKLICVEPVGDLPVLWAIILRCDVLAILNRSFPAVAHWKGPLSPAEVLAVWLLFIVSRSDHRLNQVQPWVAQHQGTLSALLGKPVQPTDAHDDRLADCLTRLAADGPWATVETDLNQHTLRVYQLATDTIRLDTTTANSYAEVLSEHGLLQFGHSKDDPSRPQFKIAMAVLDPLGMPLVTAVVPGNRADDPLYTPTIRWVQQSIGVGGRTYVGDCKMASEATRAFVASGGDFYLCPLPLAQVSAAERQELLHPVWDGTQPLLSVHRPGLKGKPDELVAEGFGVDVELTRRVGEQDVRWRERRWIVRSRAHADTEGEALERRLAKAEVAIRRLAVRKQGKKTLSEAELRAAAEALLAREGVSGLLRFTIEVTTTTSRKRAYGNRPPTAVTNTSCTMEVHRDQTAIAQKKRELGWHVYGTNRSEMGLTQVIGAYRGQYRIENDWSRLKGRPLGLTPVYLQNEARIQGLVHVLSLALRLLTLVEWPIREQLRKKNQTVVGVYAGQPGRQTSTPSAELLLEAMKTIRVSVIRVNGVVHVLLSPLNATQKRLLELWDLPLNLYEEVVMAFPKPPPITSEP